MSDLSALHSALQSRIRSVGVKLFVVSSLALLMLIPALIVDGLIEDRAKRSEDVIKEISVHSGGQQTFLGPTLAIPYSQPEYPRVSPKRGMYLVFPSAGTAALKVTTEERRRSLFKVPVFRADAKLDATFDLTGAPSALPPGAELDWDRAEMLVGVSDARGALADATLTINGTTSTLVPAAISQSIFLSGEQNSQVRLSLFGSKVESMAKPNAQFSVTSNLRFSGAQRIAVLAYGKTTHVTGRAIGRARDSMADSYQ